ncbi:MAG: MFS transporter [Burkholderiales bacterium]|nr:MFS transporter [Burkholderiales bacterium]
MTKLAKRSNIIPWVVACALFMETLDTTIISTSIPKMAYFFNVNPISLKLAMTSYLLSLAVFVPISGWIAEKYGVKKVFIFSFIVFTLSSALCGLSHNIAELVLFRIFQGFGGAIMMPVGRLILLKLYPRSDLIRVTNYATIPALFGPMVGPLAGGAISTYSDWQWIFLVNVPVGILGVILAVKFIPVIASKQVKRFDTKGFILFGIGLAGMSIVLSTVHESALSLNNRLIILATAIVSLILYAISYKKSNNPVWNLEIFNIRTFRVTVAGSLVSRIGIGGIPFLLPLLFQMGFNYSPIVSGGLVFPTAIAMFITKFFVKKILKLFGFKSVLVANTILLGLSICSFAFIHNTTSYYLIITLVFLNGAFSSMQFSCMNVLSYVDLDENNLSQGTSIASSIQQLSMSFGIAFSSIWLRLFLSHYPLHSFSTIAFSYSFWVIGISTILTSWIFSNLKAQDGITASGYKEK